MKIASLAAVFAVVAAALALPVTVGAQSYPNRTVTIVVPFPAASTTDLISRKLADYMRGVTNTPVIVDNKVGADGNIAAQYVLRSAPDGYTLFATGNSVHGANANLYKDLGFDPIKDFEMVSGLMNIPMVLSVKADSPINSVQELVAEAKKRAKPMFFASANNSTRGAAELFKARFGFPSEHVPYKGSPQAATGLMAGEFDWGFLDTQTVRAPLQAGKLKALAVTADKRLASMPNVPTVSESLSGFGFVAWSGLVAPARTPHEVITRLGTIVQGFVKEPSTLAFLSSIQASPFPLDSVQMRNFVESETRNWAEIVKAANIEKQ